MAIPIRLCIQMLAAAVNVQHRVVTCGLLIVIFGFYPTHKWLVCNVITSPVDFQWVIVIGRFRIGNGGRRFNRLAKSRSVDLGSAHRLVQ